MKETGKILEIITAGCAQVLPLDALKKKLESGKSLQIKLGADPTAPDLHLGHTVVLSKLRELQDLGHNVIFLIGDFTARIGDPTGKSKTRPALSEAEIKKNTETYFSQVSKVLDITKTTIRYNSEWLGKLLAADIVSLLSSVTVARVIEREDFQNRLRQMTPISMHELLYPLLQAYDSIVLHADIEIGGTDQMFNMLMGRFLQEQYGQEAQVVLTLPILEGINGGEKMSKSLSNAISLSLPAKEAFAKLMSISDNLMFHYAELLLSYSKDTISVLEERIAAGNLHPMELKKEIALSIVKRFWDHKEAEEAVQIFESTIQKREFTHAEEREIPHAQGSTIWIVELLKELNAISSSSEAKRFIEQGAIELDGTIIKDFSAQILLRTDMHLRVGKQKYFVVKPAKK
jgi:tyrosyl-tRNA synthetase